MIKKSLAPHSCQLSSAASSSASSSAASLVSAKIWTILIAGLIDVLALGTFAWRASMTTCHVASGVERRREERRHLKSEGEREGVLGKVALNELTDCTV